MKASPEQQRLLLRVQEIDTRLARLAALEKTPPQAARLDALAAEREALTRSGLEGGDALAEARKELERAESDVAVVEARRERDTARAAASTSSKDAVALEAELETLRRRRGELEDVQLAVMERLEGLEAEEAERDAEKARIDGESEEATRERDAALGELRAERGELAAERERVADGVPADLLDLYARQRDRYGIGAAALRGGVSLGSNVALTPSDLAEIRSAAPDEVLLDPEGGCILVRDAES